jgi:hypothetical protein
MPAAKKPAAKKAPAKKARAPKVYGYIVEEESYDYDDEYHFSYSEEVTQMVGSKVYRDKKEAEAVCLQRNRDQTDTVLHDPLSWVGCDRGGLGSLFAESETTDKPSPKFRKVCDVLIPKAKHPKVNRESVKACVKAIDGITRYDWKTFTDAQRDVLIKDGPHIFNTSWVVKVEIV